MIKNEQFVFKMMNFAESEYDFQVPSGVQSVTVTATLTTCEPKDIKLTTPIVMLCYGGGQFSTFQNPDFLVKNPDFLFRNPDFLVKWLISLQNRADLDSNARRGGRQGAECHY